MTDELLEIDDKIDEKELQKVLSSLTNATSNEVLELFNSHHSSVEYCFRNFLISDEVFERILKTAKNQNNFISQLRHVCQSTAVDDFVRLHTLNFSAEEKKKFTEILNNSAEINEVNQRRRKISDDYIRRIDELAGERQIAEQNTADQSTIEQIVQKEQENEKTYIEQMASVAQELRSAGAERRRREKVFKTLIETSLIDCHTFESAIDLLLKDAPGMKKRLKLNL